MIEPVLPSPPVIENSVAPKNSVVVSNAPNCVAMIVPPKASGAFDNLFSKPENKLFGSSYK